MHDRIRRLRLRRGLTQQDLAGPLGRDRSWVAHLERGSLSPARDQLRVLAALLGVPPKRLYGGTGWTPPPPLRTPLERAVERFDRAAGPPPPPSVAQPPRTARTLPLLERLPDGDAGLWTALGAMDLGSEDAWVLALAMAMRAAPGRLAPGRLGFPLPVLAADGSSASHRRQACLVREGPGESLVLFGATRVAWEGHRVLPAVLAASAGSNVFLAFRSEGRRTGLSGLRLASLREMTAEKAELWFASVLEQAAA